MFQINIFDTTIQIHAYMPQLVTIEDKSLLVFV